MGAAPDEPPGAVASFPRSPIRRFNMPHRMRDPVVDILREINDGLRAENTRELASLRAEMGVVGEKRWADKPIDIVGRDSPMYGGAGRTRPAWEREYTRAAQTYGWSEEEQRWRTPENDREAVDYIRAVIDNDQAMLRE